MKQTVGDFLLERLSSWGVERIFGYPGDGINGIMGAFGRRKKDGPAFIQVRHEESAAFMACGHAKFTGQVGVCLATSGPGAIHLLNGLYDAKKDHQPVVAIVGQQARASLGGEYQQEVDLGSLFKDVAHEFVEMLTTPSQIRHLVDRALRIAYAERTVTCLIVPNDLQDEPFEEPARKHGTIHSGIGYRAPRVVPETEDLQKAAQVLNEGKRVAILVGAGALNATDHVIATAEKLQAGVAKALLGKAALPDALPFVTGAIGLLGTKPSWELMTGCDTLLMIGTSFPYSEFLPKEGQARGVQIDLDGRMQSMRYPMEVMLTGDSSETLAALLPLLQQKEESKWRKDIEKDVSTWWAHLERTSMVKAEPINPERAFHELSKRLPDNCIVTCDSGSSANWYARDLKMRRGMKASLSGNLATMCPGVPYAIAAKFAYPDRVAIALVGDGAMQMLGNTNLVTVAKYWKQWADPRLIIMVLNNGDLNMVSWEQRAMSGDPKFEGSQNVPAFDYAQYARSLGLGGIRVEDPEKLGSAWDEALGAKQPVVLDVLADPNVAMLPPHITASEAAHYAQALWRGDVDRRGLVKEMIRHLVPPKPEK